MGRNLREEAVPECLGLDVRFPPLDANRTRLETLKIPSLDGIRAVAFLLVFLSHSAPGLQVPGRFGVTVFFFLSGFLITTLLRLELEDFGTINFRAFYLRRALRIFPPFYLALGVAILLERYGAPHVPYDPAALRALALHFGNYRAILHGFASMPRGTDSYWSLAVEEHFYLIFPAIYLLSCRWLRSVNQQANLLLGLCAAVLVWRCVLVFAFDAPLVRTLTGTDTRIDSILFGCVLAVRGNPALDAAGMSRRALLGAILPLGLLVLALCFALGEVAAFRETFRYSVQGLALAPLFIAAVRYPDAWLFRPLNWKPVQHLGVLSYSLYLLHGIVLSALSTGQFGLGPAMASVVGLLATLLAAEIVYRLIERPCARLRKRLLVRKAPADSAPQT